MQIRANWVRVTTISRLGQRVVLFFFGKTNFFFAANDNIKRVMEQPAIIDLSAGAAIDSAPAKLTFTNLILTSGRRVCASKVAN